jgi:hypothetical protein
VPPVRGLLAGGGGRMLTELPAPRSLGVPRGFTDVALPVASTLRSPCVLSAEWHFARADRRPVAGMWSRSTGRW